MNSNDRSSSQGFPRVSSIKPEASTEDTLKSEKIQIERKTFVFSLKENPRGRFLRITEDVGGRRDAIIIPSSGLADFAKVLEVMAHASDAITARTQP
jgi:hypothetical protein